MDNQILKSDFELFPTLVSVYSGILNDEQCSLIKDYCHKRKSSPHPTLYGEGKSSHSYYSNILYDISNELPQCSRLYEEIENIMNDYSKTLGNNSVIIENSWFNFQQKGSVLAQHVHPLSVISAAIYINTDDKSSNLYFNNPNQAVSQFYRYDECNRTKYLNDYFYIKPQNGYIIVFPSWIYHGSLNTENNTKDRLVISANGVRKS